jgi:hypothetical protein
MLLSVAILYSELKIFFNLLDIMSLNSFVPTFKFLLVSNAFLKTLNSFLILIKSPNMLSV